MKKILALAVGMLLVPFTAFGMQMMSDSDMDSITGQSGVAISLSNIQIYSDGGGDLWYETSVSADGSTQAVGIITSATESFTFINAIADPSKFITETITNGSGVFNGQLMGLDPTAQGNLMLRGDYSGFSNIFDDVGTDANLSTDYGVRRDAAVLSIRVVDNANSVFKGKANTELTDAEDFASIEIGLPTLEIYNPKGSVDAMNIVIWGGYESDTENPLSAWDGDVETNPDMIYTFGIGTIYTGGESTTAILGGRLGITSYGQVDEAYKTYSFTDSGL